MAKQRIDINSLKELYQNALRERKKTAFYEYVYKEKAIAFGETCRKIGFYEPQLVFSDSKDAIYRLRIVKTDKGYRLVQDSVNRKALKSLLGENSAVLIDTVLDYAFEYRYLKEPKLTFNFGFYYRKCGKIFPHTFTDFERNKVGYSSSSGEVNLYFSLPPVDKQSFLNLVVHAITPNCHNFLDWLAFYTFEMRRGLKKPNMAIKGDYPNILLTLIEMIYPIGVVHRSAGSQSYAKNKNWEVLVTIGFFEGAKTISYKAMYSRFSEPVKDNNVKSNSYLVGVFKNLREYSYIKDKSIAHINLYSKETQLNNLQKLGITDDNYIEVFQSQIGDFCRDYLHKRYKQLMRDENNCYVEHGYNIDDTEGNILTQEQAQQLLKFLTKKLKVTEVEYFLPELKAFLRTGLMSYDWIKNSCIQYKLNFEYVVNRFLDLGLIKDFQAEIRIENEIRSGFKITNETLI